MMLLRTEVIIQELIFILGREDLDRAGVGLVASRLRRLTGTPWPEVFGSYVRAGLPPAYQALAVMDRLDQVADRADFQRALTVATEKGGAEKLKEAAGKEKAKAIDDSLESMMTAFNATTTNSISGLVLAENMRDSVRTLAYYKAYRGEAAATALQSAYEGVLGKKYDFEGTMRVPKGRMRDARAAIWETVNELTAGDLGPVEGNPQLRPEDRINIALRAIKDNGQWIPNADDTGLVLTARGNNNQPLEVRRHNGKPVEVLFDQMKPYWQVMPGQDTDMLGNPLPAY